jgi:adenylate cyclase
VARRYPEAIEAFKHISSPDQTHQAFLAACYVQLGDAVTANGHAAEVLRRAPRRAPDFSASRYLATLHYKHNADVSHHRDALLRAGLPE